MDPLEIIDKYYKDNPKAHELILAHSKLVAKKALEIADLNPDLKIDKKFLEEGALLHDIGIIQTDSPTFSCFGKANYIAHGFLGGEMLRSESLPKHALICENHVGRGMRIKDIEKLNLDIPKIDRIPTSNEEKIICIADKFYGKYPLENITKEKTIKEIQDQLESHGEENLKEMNKMLKDFHLI